MIKGSMARVRLGLIMPSSAPPESWPRLLLGQAPGGGVGQALAHRVPQQQEAGVNPEKRQNGYENLVDDLLEVQGVRGNGGDLIEQVQFPAVLLLPRFRLLPVPPQRLWLPLPPFRVSLGVLWLR